jgi:hypothetical protein
MVLKKPGSGSVLRYGTEQVGEKNSIFKVINCNGQINHRTTNYALVSSAMKAARISFCIQQHMTFFNQGPDPDPHCFWKLDPDPD